MKFIVANVDNGEMVDGIAMTPTGAYGTTCLSAKRMMWFLESNDCIWLPKLPHQDMLNYIENLMEKDLKNTRIFSSDSSTRQAVSLQDTEWAAVLAEMKNLENEDSVSPLFYYPETNLIRMAESAAFMNYYPSEFMRQGGASKLNNKSLFRILFSDIACLPKGLVCNSEAQFISAAKMLIEDGRDVILKQALNAGGDGNIALASGDREQYFGVSKVIKTPISDDALRSIWSTIGSSSIEGSVVVEEYHQVKNVLFAEYSVSDGVIDYLCHGEIRQDKSNYPAKLLPGFSIPPSLNYLADEEFTSQCLKIMSRLSDFGFSGRANIDAVLSLDGNVYFTEINIRFGGCSHIDHIARKILGSDYIRNFHITTKSYISCSNLEKACALASILTDKEEQRGIVIANEDIEQTASVQALFYGRSFKDCEAMEALFIKLVNQEN